MEHLATLMSTVLLATVEGDQIGLVIALRHSRNVDAEKQLRAAVSDFLDTEEGARIAASNHSDFNWGDVVMELPRHYLETYGLRMTSVNATCVLNHDENLWAAKERESNGLLL